MRSKIILLFTFIGCLNISFSQFEYGAKAGIHLNTTSGNIIDASTNLTSMADVKENLTGYFIGSYVSLDILFLYLRPELQYSYLSTNFDSLSLTQSRLEAPISLGFKLLPVLSVFAGPTLQYNFEPTIKDVRLTAVEQNTTVGLHLGVRAHLGPLSADVRFDRGIKSNELELIEQNGIPIAGRIDTRNEVLSLGLSYRF
jgi:hypothetical protein